MSHFYTIVITNCPNKEEVNEDLVNQLLAPYDENIQVEEYQADCSCARYLCTKRVTDILKSRGFRTPAEYRKDFAGMFRDKYGEWEGPNIFDPGFKEQYPDHEEIRERWVEWGKLQDEYWRELVSPYYEEYDRLVEQLLPGFAPDPDCTSCHGTGKYPTTYNPMSKWDWWRVGGRWDGKITTSEEIDDGQGGFNFGEAFESMARNCCKVEELLQREEIPFALVTPDGTWHERANMGWWGITTDDKDADVWKETVLSLYRQYKDLWAVGCDCHI